MSRIDVTLALITSAFRSGLEETRNSARQFTGDIKEMFAGAFATGAIIAGLKGVIDKGDEISDLAQRFRISSEALQRLGMAAEVTGSSMETIARSMNKLRLAQSEAVNGNQDLRATFANMGISVEQLAGMGTEELYYHVADAVAGAAGETDKLQIATSVFGNRLGGELLPLLDMGGDELRRLGGSAAVMSDATIDSLGNAADEIKMLQQTFTVAFGTIVGAVIMPFINVIKTLGAAFGGYFYYMMEVVGEYAGIMKQVFSGDFSGAYDRVKHLADFMKDTFAAAAQGVKMEMAEIWDKSEEAPAPKEPTGADSMDREDSTEAAKLAKELADERTKNDRAQMDRQQKINALQAEYNALMAEAAKLTGNQKTAKLIDAEKVKVHYFHQETTLEACRLEGLPGIQRSDANYRRARRSPEPQLLMEGYISTASQFGLPPIAENGRCG